MAFSASVGINARNLVCTLSLALFVVPVGAAHANTFKVLHTFTESDGAYPNSNLVIDGNGNLYGTTGLGGLNGAGTVFELAPDGTETVLYSFAEGSGGFGPDGLTMDKKGNLWGAACCGGNADGCGILFKFTPKGREVLVHTFGGPPNDGCTPDGTLIIDANDNLYGATSGGGSGRVGAVFERNSDGAQAVLYSFCPREPPHCAHGESPDAGPIVDVAGNLFGTTGSGGSRNCSSGCGIVFELARNGTETVLYKFKGSPNDGSLPLGNLIVDQSGNFYGTLYRDGLAGCDADLGCGAVFRLAPDGTEKVLHLFAGKKGDGGNPVAGLIADGAGTLYGTTEYGGGDACTVISLGCGTVFELAPDGTEVVLHSFGKGNNGANPVGGLVADNTGTFYGTASQGGTYGYGTVFEITP